MRKAVYEILAVASGVFFIPFAVFAQFSDPTFASTSSSSSSSSPPTGTMLPNPLPFTSIPQFICKGAYALFWIALPLAVFAILVAAVFFLTSSGNPARVQRAKEALLFALIGWTVVLISGAIGIVIANFLGSSLGFGKC